MEQMYDKMRRASAIQHDEQMQKQIANAKELKTKLINIIEKKFTTTFIGDISAIEEIFGELWGQNKPKSEKTPQEQVFYEKWQLLRSRILDNGNKQLRAVLDELKQYLVSWQGYNTTLTPIRS